MSEETKPKRKRGGAQPGAGRPPFDLDYAKIEYMAKLHIPETDIASLLGVSREMLRKRREKDPEFAALFERGRASGRAKLKRQLINACDKGEVKAMIFLAKNWLDYSDRTSNDTHLTGSMTRTNVNVTADDLSDEELAQIIADAKKPSSQE